MKATPSPPASVDALLIDGEPTPLPPPPLDLDDDHYFDDDEQPSWWSSLRPVSAVRGADEAPYDLEILTPSLAPVRLPPLPAPTRTRARTRTASDEVRAIAHVLRVRARLTADEQRAFDELMLGPAATDIITMLVNRSEDDALEKLRRRIDDEPTAVEAARRSLVAQVIAVSALLSGAEKSRALGAITSLPPEEMIALEGRLAALAPAEAAALIRTYLAARR
ncbi:MAG TPA: hypothetical protein VK932_16010 [Kofleriaceae bacterium]|nr:hypothetical protein [Kofleriaceae bacterium]